LDEAFHIPGTGIRVGLDGIIGPIPGLEVVLGGLLSPVIPLPSWIRSVPCVTPVRRAANLGIGVMVGSISLFGDIFDIFWKTNGRNYVLPCRRLDEPCRQTASDWTFLMLLAAVLALVFGIPIALLVWFLSWLVGR